LGLAWSITTGRTRRGRPAHDRRRSRLSSRAREISVTPRTTAC